MNAGQPEQNCPLRPMRNRRPYQELTITRHAGGRYLVHTNAYLTLINYVDLLYFYILRTSAIVSSRTFILLIGDKGNIFPIIKPFVTKDNTRFLTEWVSSVHIFNSIIFIWKSFCTNFVRLSNFNKKLYLKKGKKKFLEKNYC